MCLGDFDIVAEHLIVTNLQRVDPRPLPLFGFQRRDPAFTFRARLAEFIDPGMVSLTNHATVAECHRSVRFDGLLNRVMHVAAIVPRLEGADQ